MLADLTGDPNSNKRLAWLGPGIVVNHAFLWRKRTLARPRETEVFRRKWPGPISTPEFFRSHHRLRRGGLTQINRQFEQEEPGDTHKSLSASATAFVKQQPWPGNVRQLDNVLSQAAVLADGATLGRGDLASALGQLPADGGPHKRRGQALRNFGIGRERL